MCQRCSWGTYPRRQPLSPAMSVSCRAPPSCSMTSSPIMFSTWRLPWTFTLSRPTCCRLCPCSPGAALPVPAMRHLPPHTSTSVLNFGLGGGSAWEVGFVKSSTARVLTDVHSAVAVPCLIVSSSGPPDTPCCYSEQYISHVGQQEGFLFALLACHHSCRYYLHMECSSCSAFHAVLPTCTYDSCCLMPGSQWSDCVS